MSVEVEFNVDGVRVLYKHVASPIVSISFGVGVGACDEDYTNRGISHFLEHSMFLGSSTIKKEEYWEKADAMGTKLNAGTYSNQTMFHCTCLQDKFEDSFSLLSDLFLDVQFPVDEFEKERGIVIDEIRRGNDDHWDHFYRQMYNKCYGYPIIGDISIIENMDIEEVKAWRDAHYRGDNVLVTVVGDVTQEHVADLVAKYWKAFNRDKVEVISPKNNYFNAPDTTELLYKEGIGENYLLIAQEVLPMEHYDYHQQVILNQLLGGGGSSRLFKRIREELGIVYGIHSSLIVNQHFNFRHITTSCAEEQMPIVESEIKLILEDLKNGNITATEVDVAKNSFLSSLLHGEQQTININIKIASLYLRNQGEFYKKYTDNIKRVTVEDVIRVAENTIGNSAYTAIMKKSQD